MICVDIVVYTCTTAEDFIHITPVLYSTPAQWAIIVLDCVVKW